MGVWGPTPSHRRRPSAYVQTMQMEKQPAPTWDKRFCKALAKVPASIHTVHPRQTMAGWQ